VTCRSASSCWAVGISNSAGGTEQALIEQYAGSGWSIVSSPSPPGSLDSQLASVACVSATDCWAVGYSDTSNPPNGNPTSPNLIDQTLIEQYTGTGWTIVSSPTPSDETSAQVEGVACTSSGDCWAVGGPSPKWGSGSGETLIEHAYQPAV
jgi:hypothetical protein